MQAQFNSTSMAASPALAAAAASLLHICRHKAAERSVTIMNRLNSCGWSLTSAPYIPGSVDASGRACLHSVPSRQQGLLQRVRSIAKELAVELQLSAEQLSQLDGLKGRSALMHAEHLLGKAPEAAQAKFLRLVYREQAAQPQELLPFTMHIMSGLVEREVLEQIKQMTPQQVRALPDFESLAAEARTAGAAEGHLEQAVKQIMMEAIECADWEDLLPLSQCWPALESLLGPFPALEGPLGLLGVRVAVVKQDVAAQQLLESIRVSDSTSPQTLEVAQYLRGQVQQQLVADADPDVTLIRRILSLHTYPQQLSSENKLEATYQEAVLALEAHLQTASTHTDASINSQLSNGTNLCGGSSINDSSSESGSDRISNSGSASNSDSGSASNSGSVSASQAGVAHELPSLNASSESSSSSSPPAPSASIVENEITDDLTIENTSTSSTSSSGEGGGVSTEVSASCVSGDFATVNSEGGNVTSSTSSSSNGETIIPPSIERERFAASGGAGESVATVTGEREVDTTMDTNLGESSSSSVGSGGGLVQGRETSSLDVIKFAVVELRGRGDNNPVELFFAELGRLRQEALLTGPCQLLLSVASEELREMPDGLFKDIRRRIFCLHESGRQLSRQLLEGSVHLAQLHELPADEREAVLWCLLMEGVVGQGREVLSGLLRQHVLKEEWRRLHQFDLAKRAVESHLLEDAMVASHPSTGLRGEYKPGPNFAKNRFLDMLRASGVPGSMITGGASEGSMHEVLTPDWLMPDSVGQPAAQALAPAQRQAAQVLGSCPIVGDVFVPTQGSPEFADYQQQALSHLSAANIDWESIQGQQPTHLVSGWGRQKGLMRLRTGYPDWMAAANAAIINLPKSTKQLLSTYTETRLQTKGLVRKRGKAREAHKKLAALHEFLNEQERLRSEAPRTVPVEAPAEKSLQDEYRLVAERHMDDEIGAIRHMVQVLLGEAEARKFADWFVALQQSSKRGQRGAADEPLDSYEILQNLHMAMDEERYLRMQFEPEMLLDVDSSLRMESRRGAVFNRTEPSQFLDQIQPFLNKYLEASGHAPVEGSEWQVYKTGALWDLQPLRAGNHAQQLKQGDSGWFDPQRESHYLQNLLKDSIPASNPLHAVGLKYLSVVEANPSWKFSHKKHMVMRLVELSKKLHLSSTHEAGMQSPLASVLGEEGLPLEIGLSLDPRKAMAAGGKSAVPARTGSKALQGSR